jgi:rfaE bifunctional protein kinase chain/domain
LKAPPKIRSLPVPTLEQLTLSFPKRRVLVVGDFVADHYIYGQTERVSREAPVLIVRYESSDVKLGGGANAAANVRSMGGQVTALGILGNDEMGRALRDHFKAAGIRILAPAAKGLATETKTRILAGGINTTRQQMLRLDRTAQGPLPARVRLELRRLILEGAKNADAIVVSDYGSGVLNAETRGTLRKLAADGLPVCVDSRYALRDYAGFTVCKPNEPELQALTGLVVRDDASLLAAGHKAMELLGCKSLLVTRGRNGMAIFDAHGNVEHLPVYGSDEAVDVTGAGDTVVAALTLALAAGASVVDAAKIANVAGGIVVMKPGTATVTQKELLSELGA